ncbi:hypothetical protein QQG55_4975 [Brugia pahangi]
MIDQSEVMLVRDQFEVSVTISFTCNVYKILRIMIFSGTLSLAEMAWAEYSAAFVHCMTALIITHETTPTSFFCHYYRSLA